MYVLFDCFTEGHICFAQGLLTQKSSVGLPGANSKAFFWRKNQTQEMERTNWI